MSKKNYQLDRFSQALQSSSWVEDPASKIYVKNKIKTLENVGIKTFLYNLPIEIGEEDLVALINSLNKTSITGILVQLPLPKHLDVYNVVNKIDPTKDVDGLSKQALVTPCTAEASLLAIKSVHPDLTGLNAVIIGRSNLVGKPLFNLLLNEDATVTMTHSKTRDLPSICSQADILVVAVGSPELVRGDWIKPGAIIIDVGINTCDGKITGDVCFSEVIKIAGAITPVPGGIGPMTIAVLASNLVKLI